MTLAIGLMSGTSADGVTAALVRFTGRFVLVLKSRTLAYPAALRRRVLGASELSVPELSFLNMELGEHFAKAALGVLDGAGKVAAIGSHGQTVWHSPGRDTLQLAEPAVIAERTGLTVVADFRPRDIAAGGQGAPLMPAFDEFLYAGGPLRALQNIGGIGNVTVAGKDKVWGGFDTGPGNCLMDLAARTATGGRALMDRDGKWAKAGRADVQKVERMLRDPFFKKSPPRSLERTYFGESFLRKHFGRVTTANLKDVMATLNLLTAKSIWHAYFLLGKKTGYHGCLEEVVVSGGGALNPALMKNLAAVMAPIPVVSSAERGIPPLAKEAACFAWLALRALANGPNNCPAATGAKGPRVLGKIVPA